MNVSPPKVHPDGAKTVALGPNQVTVLLSGGQTRGQYSLTEFVAAPPPAPGPPPHIHADADEMIYVLDGTWEFMLAGRTFAAPVGSCVFIPKGTQHSVANVGTTRATILIVLTPPGFEGFWVELAERGNLTREESLALQGKYHVDMGGKVRSL